MANGAAKIHRHVRLSGDKIRRVQLAFGVTTETEAIERALDYVIAEAGANRLAIKSHIRFLRGGAEIRDVYGALES